MNIKNIIKKTIYVLIIMTIFIIAKRNNVNAASANILCNTNCNVNEPMTISVTGTAAQWNLSLSVDRKSYSIWK